jgi:hypothetical protein
VATEVEELIVEKVDVRGLRAGPTIEDEPRRINGQVSDGLALPNRGQRLD